MKAGKAIVLQGDALALPLPDESVDLVVTSPPYFALRSYQDAGTHYAGQIGSEPTPAEFVDALVKATREMVRVLKPSGSIFVNLGDKYAGSGGHNNSGIGSPAARGPKHYNRQAGGVRPKSLMGLPWRYALQCVDVLDLILRQEIIWAKPNGMPESVADRCRRAHEQWFHFTKEPVYFSAVDEVREPSTTADDPRATPDRYDATKGSWHDHEADAVAGNHQGTKPKTYNPLGKVPGSVRTVPTEALRVPDFAIEDDKGWRMFGKATATPAQSERVRRDLWDYAERRHLEGAEFLRIFEPDHFAAFPTEWPRWLILWWAPVAGVVLDPFGGTGTTAMIARTLGRVGISVDLSRDYTRLARWRVNESGHGTKAMAKTAKERQGAML